MGQEIKSGMMKYCVIGNIIKERIDENGMIRYGTASFPGDRKVYISRRLWKDGVTIMGLNRFKSRYILETIPLEWIENIRSSKTFKPRVIELMKDTDPFHDMWWLYHEEDKSGTIEYAQLLNRIKNGDQKAFEQYYQDVMIQYY